MLIKTKDDESALLKDLELRATGDGPAARQAVTELRIRQAGLKGERESAYLIDFHFERSPNWAVIHDLRLEHGGRTAQIDHLLINRRLEIYVLETKHFQAGFKITDDGEFLRWNAYRKTYEGMASPLEQNERHIAVLRDVVETLEWPQRMGLRIPPAFHSLVLVAPNARIDRPGRERFDSSRVIKADLLRTQIDKDFGADGALMALLKSTAKLVSGDTVAGVARQLVELHRPLRHSPPPVPVPAPHAGVEHAGLEHAGVEPASPPAAAAATAPAPALQSAPSAAATHDAASAEAASISRNQKPLPAPSSVAAATQAPPPLPTRAADVGAPACKACQSEKGEILYGKFGYYFKCEACAANTAIRFVCQPGHKPRLRKEGPAFYRECADCGSSALYHRNAR